MQKIQFTKENIKRVQHVPEFMNYVQNEQRNRHI